MKRIKKVFAALLSFVMMLTLLPAMTHADTGSGSAGNNSGVVVEKTATLEDDGTYTINLSAYATGTTTTVTEKSGVPLDIVLVLDQSGSMEGRLSDLKTAVRNFVDTIAGNASEYNVDHRIAVVGFASAENSGSWDGVKYNYLNSELFIGKKQYNYNENGNGSTEETIASTQYQNAFQTVTNSVGRQNLSDSINELAALGGTYPNLGMEMANGIFGANDNSYTKLDGTAGVRKRIVVMFTDGKPGDSGFDTTVANATIEEAYTSKNTYGATVYTVGLYSDADNDVTTFMNYVSSNYPTAQSIGTGDYIYTPVYSSDVNTTNTYYVILDDEYTAVTYQDGKWRRQDNGKNSYTPKTRANDNKHTQFYTRSEVFAPEKVDDKYYMTTSNSDELNNIFQNITSDIQNPSTSVTLDGGSVMRDVIADGFELPVGYDPLANIMIKTMSGSTTDGTNITWGDETTSPGDVTASVDGQNVNITGFDYSDKYIAPSHDGEKLMVTIKGIIPTDAAVTNEQVDTNTSASGIYATAAAESCIPFPQPKTVLTSKTYVLDYAKDFTMVASDWKQNTTTLYGSFTKSSASPEYGILEDLKYTPKTTNWNGYDSFYAFGKTTDTSVTAASANANGNLWSKVSVIPADNVYYEDDFITNESNGTVGIEYTGSWTTDGTSAKNKEHANGDDIQGWEASLADDDAYSDGSAHVASTSDAIASFTFTGTGVDIYSRTNQTTGTIYVTVKSTKDGTTTTKRTVVDNKANSGDYYQIPTYTFGGAYGTYEVTVRVTSGAASEGRSTYYLDGIRVYNPIQKLESDPTVQEAYGADELNAVFTEVRSLLDENSGVAFIDEDGSGNSVSKNYKDAEVSALAPEHEVYLAKGQSIVFSVKENSSNFYYIGLKAPAGGTSVAFSQEANAATTSIVHTTDLYYRVTPNNGRIVVKNTGDNLLSVTKLRTAGSGESGISMMSADQAVSAVMAFNAAPQVAYQSVGATDEELTESETPAVTEPETAEPDETTADEPGEVIIENPEVPEGEPVQTPSAVSNSWVGNLFSSIRNIFGRW